MTKSILFVCIGNTCRSPVAEGICKKLIKNINCESRGINVFQINKPANEKSQKICLNNNIDISNHKCKQFEIIDINNFDYIIALDKYVFEYFNKFENNNKILLLNSPNGIEDPFGNDFKSYEKMFNDINSNLSTLLKTLIL